MKATSAIARLETLNNQAEAAERLQPGPFAMRHLDPEGIEEREEIIRACADEKDAEFAAIEAAVAELRAKFDPVLWDRIVDELYAMGCVPHSVVRHAMHS
jgi:hypothetical protein